MHGYIIIDGATALTGQGVINPVTILDPKGGEPEHVPMPDALTTNICFGGGDLKTAYITLSSTGQLVSVPWESAGLPLNYLNR